ncbi:DMT family transporter [Acidisoma cladoniae]|jgi:drug/metabolite transporter (DMT)-like permease|uniref:DMT family transporter n=1 Tax=Acidisoma cladoniae TaxID=3040935 RepID=UPI0025513B8C|nr:DMT family transporter [Acidisoma sp. PAMC 29798]
MVRAENGFAGLIRLVGRALPGSPSARGLIVVLFSYFFFALHDAMVKVLVARYDAPEILFIRSLTVVVLCLTLGGRGVVTRGLFSPVRGKLLTRAVLTLIAWLLYYSSARYLELPQLITIYFASPLIIAVMAGPMLGEKVTAIRWVALAIGFVGVLLAARPHGASHILPVLCVGAAAVIWAYAMILMRQIASELRGFDQVFVIAVLFLITCGASLPFLWKTPSLPALLLMLSLGIMSTIAQLLLIEGVKLAQASVIAPMEFSGLLWSFVFGYLIFGDIPNADIFLGAGFILLSGGMVVISEIRQGRRNRLLRQSP